MTILNTSKEETVMAKILVLESEDLLATIIKFKLLKAGHRIIRAVNPDQAMSQIRIEKPDLILVDVYNNSFDGFSALKEIKSDPGSKEIPVIIVTSYDDEIVARGLKMGADDYIAKPFMPAELLTLVKNKLIRSGKEYYMV
jgi:DNA-binding response OmpR family regulator